MTRWPIRSTSSRWACAQQQAGRTRARTATVPGVDNFLPVDVYVAGCPPRPDALMYAIIQLQKKITNREIDEGHARWRAWQREYRVHPAKLRNGRLVRA